jgi:membrane-anchored mycosin MYCP
MRRLTGTLAAVLAAGLLVGPAPAAHAEDTACQDTPPDRGEGALAESRGRLPMLLSLDEAHEVATGKGVGVAVIDTGVAPGARGGGEIDVRRELTASGVPQRIVDSHGTLVGGLVAGRNQEGRALGVAPGAHVVSIKVADARREIAVGLNDVSTPVPLTPERVAEAVRTATALRDELNIRVINLSLNLERRASDVEKALRAAIDRGIVVVAAVGNRPQSDREDPDPRTAYRVGEQEVRFPATLPGVIAVTGLGEDDTLDPSLVWTGPEVDVSAPVFDAVTVNRGGTTCLIQTPGTSWAAAQVSGLAALVLDRFGSLTPAQVATRITATARGALDDSALDGHGMIQPVEALTAQLDIAPDGRLRQPATFQPPQREVAPPTIEGDPFAGMRSSLLWWGLGGGGALVGALLLRPLLARRR